MIRLNGDGTALELSCSGCNAVNRVPAARLGQVAKCGRCATPLRVDRPVNVDDGTFAGLTRVATVPVLLDVWAPWCAPCRMVAPELEKVARERASRVLVAKLNSDENPAVSAQLGIRSIPALLLFRGGQEVAREVGALPAAGILSLLDLHSG